MSIFKISQMLLLQVDIEGSSARGILSRSILTVAEEKQQLAERIRSALLVYGFSLVSWKGDGGVYAFKMHELDSWDFSVDAADDVAAVFSKWRQEKEERGFLRLRISIHHTPTMAIHEERGYWFSNDMNTFIKYEREIGVSGTIAVTDPVYECLEHARHRFVWERQRSLGDSHIRTIYYAPIDSEAKLNQETPLGFFAWLRQTQLPNVSWQHEVIGPPGKAKAFIGDSCVLFASPHPESSLTIDFVRSKESNPPPPPLTIGETRKWEELKDKVLKGSMGFNEKKVSVCSATTPLTDIPASEVLYRDISWRDARSFHALLNDGSDTYNRLARNALKIVEEGTDLPGIACCHVIVRTADVLGDAKGILLCQRQNKGAPMNAYARGRWSLSFEEQMRPGESVMTCVQRGLAEELLGSEEKVTPEIRVLGAILEPGILNFCTIVLVDLPMKFDEVVNSWQDSVDKDEHRLIALINGDRRTYESLATGGEVPPEIREKLRPSHKEVFDQTDGWQLHKTTIVRFAFALWAQEMLAPR